MWSLTAGKVSNQVEVLTAVLTARLAVDLSWSLASRPQL